MKRFLSMYRVEQKIFFRSPDMILFCLAMPLGVGIDLLKSVSIGCYDKIVMPVVILTAIAVICGAVAVKTFRWE